ncbi:acyl-CoA dehydrogenase family protein [Winogradskya consettensis]|uniref:Acyl-CoA dehydrogenase n=1 Tax=Winogradskya consettensis TaxID=113560 RepID=A0A919VZJ1_9ACTN|nr:acyl-CoA dehydrogenase family protein [Actinoplanes consettensis]GIM82009.1 acyl-CoA dehydrogenase [Actinoplanes consettensis]
MTVIDVQKSDVLGAVRDIVPALRDNARASEERRWILDENIQMLQDAGVFRIATPERFGGLDLPLASQGEVIAEIARGCGSTGWAAMVWVSNAWCATLYPDEVQKEVFTTPDVRISGGFTPSGRLVATEGGYVLNGSWRFNSACRGSAWNLAAALLEGADGEVEEVVALVPMDQFTIADDWDTFAAKGTGSSTTTAKDVFVPARRVVTFEQALVDNAPGRDHVHDSPRRYGLFPIVMVECAAACLGIARGALDVFLQRVPNRPITYTNWTDQRQHPLTQIQVATAVNKIAAAEALIAVWTTRAQERADAASELSVEERAYLRGQTAYAIKLAREAVEILYGASGASVIQHSVAIQRSFRDIEGFGQHALLLAETNLEVQGRVLLGLDPDTPFL